MRYLGVHLLFEVAADSAHGAIVAHPERLKDENRSFQAEHWYSLERSQ